MIKVTILGCGSAKPTAERHPSAQVVNVNEQYFLVDAGEGVQQQMFRCGLNPLRLRAVMVSHLHGDHIFGLFPLISTLGMYGRRTPLQVYAPAPFGEILDHFLRHFESELPYAVQWMEVDTVRSGPVFSNRTVEVRSIPLSHRIPTAGYLFREREPALNVDKAAIERYGLAVSQIVAAKRGEDVTLADGRTIPNAAITYRPFEPASYAYCSDTASDSGIARCAAGVDLLYHEATYADDMAVQAAQRGHSTASEAARCALAAGAGRLLIGHFSSRYKDAQPLLDEARRIFPSADMAVEGETYTISKPNER